MELQRGLSEFDKFGLCGYWFVLVYLSIAPKQMYLTSKYSSKP